MSSTLLLGLFLGFSHALYHRLKDFYTRSKNGTLAVVVCGDIGRSPRMCNHIVEVIQRMKAGVLTEYTNVSIIGYVDTPLSNVITSYQDDCVSIHPIKRYICTEKSMGKWRRIFAALIKMQIELFTIWFCLARAPQLKAVIMQNPPAAPHSIVASIVSRIRGAQVILDIHNYGYTIAQMNPRLNNLTWLLRQVEQVGFWTSHRRLVVSQAMQQHLQQTLKLDSRVVYDRRNFAVHPSPQEGKRSVLKKYLKTSSDFLDDPSTAVLLTATSYTADEDLFTLLQALEDYAMKRQADPSRLPRVLVVITGKGPLEEEVRQQAQNKTNGDHVMLEQIFTTIEDYPRAVASADLGICLHTSSSKLDIPMKIVDMLSVEVPVIAYKYETLKEILHTDLFNLCFSSVEELVARLQDILSHFPNSERLRNLTDSCHRKDEVSWEEQWESEVLSLLLGTKKL